jgi:hypothetical protein
MPVLGLGVAFQHWCIMMLRNTLRGLRFKDEARA